ncbi:MAG TPA: circularly permuted type 2 ATP-grasp protein [Polyangiaceae bacterium]|nr:circularly permuted type 2 ATP-grasp protein [Polyangiaceae bacterium]
MTVPGVPKTPLFGDYEPIDGTYDEFFSATGQARPDVAQLVRALDRLGQREFQKRQALANSAFLNAGVTFSVYSDERGGERVFPFDLIPRVISAEEWDRVERGLAQRVQALNLFLHDVYGKQAILSEDVLPSRLVLGSSGYLERLRGVTPPGGVYIHVAGIDLIRSPTGEFLVLEDNVRTPSGVSYVLENRGVMKRALPSVFKKLHVRSVDDYPTVLRDTLLESAPSSAPGGGSIPPSPDSPVRAVVLTPGPFNSAYFEHSFLAGRMGCELAYASDLFVRDKKVYLKTTAGPQQIHVIYRRIDDAYLDPDFFRPDSLLGVAGLVSAYAAGNVTLANALGNGVADDKAIYPYVPEMIRFYLSEEPLLEQVQTYNLSRKPDFEYTLDHLDKLVVKAVDGSGGYGMLMGPTASESERAEFATKLRENPRGYIAQPRIELSTAPTWCDTELAPRRVDLRPFVLTGKKVWVLPGGLSRVALRANSYVVNSSQGGGSKDTWVLGAGVP